MDMIRPEEVIHRIEDYVKNGQAGYLARQDLELTKPYLKRSQRDIQLTNGC